MKINFYSILYIIFVPVIFFYFILNPVVFISLFNTSLFNIMFVLLILLFALIMWGMVYTH